MTAIEHERTLPLTLRRPRRWPYAILIVVTVVILVDAVFGESGYVARLQARHDYERRIERLTAVRLENLALAERKRRLNEDPDAVEEAARQDLGLLRRGEIVFLIRDQRQQR